MLNATIKADLLRYTGETSSGKFLPSLHHSGLQVYFFSQEITSIQKKFILGLHLQNSTTTLTLIFMVSKFLRQPKSAKDYTLVIGEQSSSMQKQLLEITATCLQE